MRALLVDDEQPARERLRRLLQAHPEIEIAGEAEDGVQALEKIEELRPGLVFLDVQMPGCSGLEVAAALASTRPKVVFCTAFDEYAVDAFELHAMDYLLKPVTRGCPERSSGSSSDRRRRPRPGSPGPDVRSPDRRRVSWPARARGTASSRATRCCVLSRTAA